MATLLLIEDHEMSRDMLARRLRRRGYEVHAAEEPEEGVRLALEVQPDLVLMGADGWEATRRLRDDARTRTTPVIAMSAYATPADRRRAIEAGCDDFEPKPVELDRLLRKIAALLQATGVAVPDGALRASVAGPVLGDVATEELPDGGARQ